MNDADPPLLDPAPLPRRALCIAVHSGDEVRGCGGMLAFHAARGDALRVVVVCGAAGDRELATARENNAHAALALGPGAVRRLGFAEGALASRTDLVSALKSELEDFGPELVYGPAPFELDFDHRSTSAALASALASGTARRVLLYGIDASVPAGVRFDTTAHAAKKRAALACRASTRASEGECEAPDRGRAIDDIGRGRAIDDIGRGRAIDPTDPQDPFFSRDPYVEGFASLAHDEIQSYHASARALLAHGRARRNGSASIATLSIPATTAVVSTWNKRDDVRANLEALRAQTLPFAEIVVVDNASSDGTAEMIAREFPEVRLVVMPHARYGACETFNIGFSSARTELVAILDDDIVMPPEWLEKATERMLREPQTTAILSTQVLEPGTPESYLRSPLVNEERYMSTFRGCASLARAKALREAEYYDERLFIYGNERDLTCRLLNLGYRVLQFPGCGVFHKTPFGIKLGKRSLYYHARNAWLSMLKYAPLSDLARMPWLVLTKVVMRRSRAEAAGEVRDAVGTIGIGKSLRETPGAWWILVRAAFSVLFNVPYCLKHRHPVRAPDFELPLH